MNKWDIVLVRYPFTDLTAKKARPAVIISPDSAVGDDAVFIAITGNITKPAPQDLLILHNHPEFAATGLQFASLIKIGKLFTLEKSLVAKPLGKAGPQLQARINDNLRAFLEL